MRVIMPKKKQSSGNPTKSKTTKRKEEDSNESIQHHKKRKLGTGDKESSEAEIDSATGTPSSVSKTHVRGDDSIVNKLAAKRCSVAPSVTEFKFNKKRVQILCGENEFPDKMNGVLYWMTRDQRVQDNWSFLYAQRLALKFKVPLSACFCLVPETPDATIRHYGFMLKGLEEVEKECRDLDISFHLLLGAPKECVTEFVTQNRIGSIVTDFSPLRDSRQCIEDLKKTLSSDIPVAQVDAHNIVPCWHASPKLEYGARTIRNKITKELPQFLTDFPPLVKHPYRVGKMPTPVDWAGAMKSLDVDHTVAEVSWAVPGTAGGLAMLEEFCLKRLPIYASDRNNPNKEALSNLSPWLHFGQISAQRCVLTVKEYKTPKTKEGVDVYIEEAIVRRELSDNFCFYNDNYDNIKGAWSWAQETLQMHAKDPRQPLYSQEELEKAKTYDDLWNASQCQLVIEGKLHGFLRMYWAKKILEWTKSPEEALRIAIYLNDKYSLDGSDPNGFVGCMWSVCGIHDQGWKERPVFGKIRYMNYQGCLRKFDVKAFVKRYPPTKMP